jgi:hypothetical protein
MKAVNVDDASLNNSSSGDVSLGVPLEPALCQYYCLNTQFSRMILTSCCTNLMKISLSDDLEEEPPVERGGKERNDRARRKKLGTWDLVI